MITRARQNVIGLDIGGANLKAARPDGAARSQTFQLWKSPELLGKNLRKLLAGWKVKHLGVTMTGELCDCFETKRDGVRRILAQVEQAFPGIPIGVWNTTGKFVTPTKALRVHLQVAAANWHALATFAGRSWLADTQSALIIDTGSTTTDIIPIWQGRPVSNGLTDSARLQSQELIYTGVRRTPVCSLLSTAIAAEFFATTHDVYLRLGMTVDQPDCVDTADGRPATAKCAHARLSRMLGGDPRITPAVETLKLAHRAYARQREMIREAIRVVARHLPELPKIVMFYGSGEFLARDAFRECAPDLGDGAGKPCKLISFAELISPESSAAACAYAVAKLAVET
jgi:probable H4MPT-linked C1 transfer pathway protein